MFFLIISFFDAFLQALKQNLKANFQYVYQRFPKLQNFKVSQLARTNFHTPHKGIEAYDDVN